MTRVEVVTELRKIADDIESGEYAKDDQGDIYIDAAIQDVGVFMERPENKRTI